MNGYIVSADAPGWLFRSPFSLFLGVAGLLVGEIVPEPELRRRYEGLRADRLARTRFNAQRDLTRSTIMLLVAAALFLVHWRWARSLARPADAGTAAAPRASPI